ncbi:hypothetical protein C5L14_16720 [Labrys okinawensis]|uniref:Uncharacterized protein n=1 Tax=Labrys okinawensis TaxID=346911 RepID=A0A2S9QC55_9HYPH|nr:hypothetical protein [Labrys okinawensis]PRH86929.1 hypothetical protein C5L14_16720 [Labrys okinawensis]
MPTMSEKHRAQAIRAAGREVERPRLAERLIAEGCSINEAKARIEAAHSRAVARNLREALDVLVTNGPKSGNEQSWTDAVESLRGEIAAMEAGEQHAKAQ